MILRHRAIENFLFFTIFLSVLSLAFAPYIGAQPPTTSGALTQDETWSASVILTGDVIVPAGISLVIEPGATIYFTALSDDQAGGPDPARTELIVEGTLIAEQATFTSSNILSQARGDWGGIHLTPSLDNTGISLNDCTIEFAGTGITALFSRRNGHLHISSTRVRYNLSDGISITGENNADFTIDLQDNESYDNDDSGLFCQVNDNGSILDGMITGNSIHNNKGPGIRLLADGSERVGFLIEGNEIQSNRTYNISFESRSNLTYFNVSQNNITGGDLGIYFKALEGTSDILVTANDILNGAEGIYLVNEAGQPLTAVIEHNTIANQIGDGIIAAAAGDNALIDIDIRNNSITDNTGNGIELSGSATYPTDLHSTITLNTVLNNQGWGIIGQTTTSANIFHNDIRLNNEGIYVDAEEKAKIHYNNLYDNADSFYDYELANGSGINVDARFNYWGPQITDELSFWGAHPDHTFYKLLWHKSNDASLGKIHTSDWLVSGIAIPTGPQSPTITPVHESIHNEPAISFSGFAVAPYGVEKVELSFDNGQTWHSATGNSDWQLEWDFPQDGSYTVASRVTDNLGQATVNLPGNSFVVDSTLPGYSGELTGTTTWENQVLITGDVTVPAGATLTIKPGTIVRFQARNDDQQGGNHEYRSELLVRGSLQANQAIFTSANATHPVPGDWLGIRFKPQDPYPAFNLNNCTVEYAMTGIDVTVQPPVIQSNVTVLNSIIRQNALSGIDIWGKDGVRVDFQATNNQITTNGNSGIYARSTAASTQFYVSITENTISGNAHFGIFSGFSDSADSSLTISENYIYNHDSSGIFVSLSRARSIFDIRSNIISDYMRTGINVSLSGEALDNHIQIRSNEIYNGNKGITVSDSDDAAAKVDIADNTIFNQVETGVEIYKTSNDAPPLLADIRSNRIFANGGNGIELGDGQYQLYSTGEIEANIALNTVQGNGGHGLYLLISQPLDIRYNEIFDNDGGLYLRTKTDAFVQYNDIYENGNGYALELVHLSQSAVDARYNYWGTAPTVQMDTGPNPKNIDVILDDFDDSVLGVVDYDGWLDRSITVLDSDADKLTDQQEFEYGTDPQNSDTDNDLANDSEEVRYGSDPNDDQSLPYTVYEDAEDGLKTGWFVYAGDSARASIENIYDSERNSRAIALSGSGVDHGYALFSSILTEWNNTTEFRVEWNLKYTEPFIVYIKVQTTDGRRYLQYTPVDYSYLGDGSSIHHGVGTHTIDGTWHKLTRDLDADLKDAQPHLNILSVSAFLIRGSGMVDDIKLTSHTADSDLDGLDDMSETETHGTDPILTDTDGDGLTDSEEIEAYGTNPNDPDSDHDGIDDGAELAHWQYDSHLDSDNDGLANLLDEDSDGDGVLDGTEIDHGTDPQDASSAPPTVYEDAEQINTEGWFVYTGDPGTAAISNVLDAERGSQAIELNGNGQGHGYAFYGANGLPWQNDRQFIVEWSMKYSEFFTVYVEVLTTAGRRYLQYTPVDYDNLGTGSLVHHGVGADTMDGTWRRYIRDLAEDLNAVQPDAIIHSVEGFLIRGSGRVDDIQLWTTVPDTDDDGLTDLEENNIYYTSYLNDDTDFDGIGDSEEITTYSTIPTVADTDADGISDGAELSYWQNIQTDRWSADSDGDGLINLVDPDSDNDGALDGVEVSEGSNPEDSSDTPASVYEDAEDEQTVRWDVYDGDPATASIDNQLDSQRGNQVIVLTGESTIHGFRLGTETSRQWKNSAQFTLDLSMRFSEYYIIYIDVQTTEGHRYLKYTPSDYSDLGSGEYVHHGLGWNTRNSQWHDLTIDLLSDLQEAQPGAEITEVNGLLIRGSGRVDDVRLR